MKEHPILMNTTMVRAILDGKKFQTRRIIKPQPAHGCEYRINGNKNAALHIATEPFNAKQFDRCWVPPTGKHKDHILRSPFGGPGSRLWVRETHAIWEKEPWIEGGVTITPPERGVYYLADKEAAHQVSKWKPSIHMPRWAARLVLEIVDVGVERLNDISGSDAVAEGITETRFWRPKEVNNKGFEAKMWDDFHFWNNYPQIPFKRLWEHLNGKGSWEENPWVWKIVFKRAN